MGLWQRIFGSPPRRQSEGRRLEKAPNLQPPVLNPWLTTTPIFPVGDYFVFSQQGYLRNELVYRGINMLAGAIAEAPIRVYSRGGEALEDHPMRRLIKRPNPFMGEHLLWELSVIHLYLSGNAFWVKVRSTSGRVVEVWPLRPDRLRIIPDNTRFVGGYIYEIGGRQYPLDSTDVIHFKFPHPIYDYWGLSPLQAALRRIVIDNETADFTKVLLQNNATPSIAVTTQSAIDQATADRLSVRWREKFGGRNRGIPAFLQAGMDIKTIGLSMKDLAFPELDASSQKRVLVALGVPPVLLGQEATFSNYEQARVSFYEDTVEPLQSRLDDRLESDLLYLDFGDSRELELKFDTSKVSALRPVRRLKWENAEKGLTAGFLTVNRALALVGERPAPDGDVYLRPLTMVAVAEREAQAQDGAEVDSARRFAALGSELAERYFRRLNSWAREEFARHSRDVAGAVNRRREPLTQQRIEEIARELGALAARWEEQALQSAMRLVAALIGELDGAAVCGPGVRPRQSEGRIVGFTSSYACDLAERISAVSVADVRELLAEAASQAWSIRELRGALQKKFTDWDTWRAEMVAHAETLRAADASAIAGASQLPICHRSPSPMTGED